MFLEIDQDKDTPQCHGDVMLLRGSRRVQSCNLSPMEGGKFRSASSRCKLLSRGNYDRSCFSGRTLAVAQCIPLSFYEISYKAHKTTPLRGRFF